MYFFFLTGFSLTSHLRVAGQQRKGTPILTPLCLFHSLHKYLDVSQAITAESSPLHLATDLTPSTIRL